MRKNHFSKTVLPNGLTVLVEKQRCRSLSIAVWVKTGTRYERSNEAGISHFLEHMMFKGTQTRNTLEIAQTVDRVGGEFNAFTAREYTCFHLLVLKKDLSLAMDVLSDILLRSLFEAEELERERKVILQEISMVEEAPEELVHDLYFEMIYGRHGLGRSILGSANSLRRMRRGDVIRFFRRHYRPERTIISIVGDVSPALAKKKVKAFFKKPWTGRVASEKSEKKWGLSSPPSPKAIRAWVPRPLEQAHIVWGVEATSFNSKDRFAMNVLNAYLGNGMSAALFQEIREKHGLAYTVYSMLSPFHDSGMFTVYAATSVKQIVQCVQLLEETINKTRTHLLPEDELQGVKDSLIGTILLASDSVESRMTSMATQEIYAKKFLSAEEICERIQAVTAQELRRIAKRYFRPEKVSILVMGPKPSRVIRRKLSLKLLAR